MKEAGFVLRAVNVQYRTSNYWLGLQSRDTQPVQLPCQAFFDDFARDRLQFGPDWHVPTKELDDAFFAYVESRGQPKIKVDGFTPQKVTKMLEQRGVVRKLYEADGHHPAFTGVKMTGQRAELFLADAAEQFVDSFCTHTRDFCTSQPDIKGHWELFVSRIPDGQIPFHFTWTRFLQHLKGKLEYQPKCHGKSQRGLKSPTGLWLSAPNQ